MESPFFYIYPFEFTCSHCGEQGCMGVINFSTTHINICDLCLVNEISEEEKTKYLEKLKVMQAAPANPQIPRS
ncbi:MAG TPA: hypothetical protein DCM08_11590 [Microscillaceae bacterium]|jgi:ArsR family metal-binding transcriptional regulator|nr:hypothetical protein [Microscillaceae bacterium]